MVDRTLNSLRRYYKYLKTRIRYEKVGLIDLPDKEIDRVKLSLKLYENAFIKNGAQFTRCFLYKVKKLEPEERKRFYNRLEILKNEILESEKND